jgi:hypothetical protein
MHDFRERFTVKVVRESAIIIMGNFFYQLGSHFDSCALRAMGEDEKIGFQRCWSNLKII